MGLPLQPGNINDLEIVVNIRKKKSVIETHAFKGCAQRKALNQWQKVLLCHLQKRILGLFKFFS